MIDYGFGVSLEKIGEKNLEILRSWRNNVEIRRWCRQTDLISTLDQKAWYEKQNSDPTIKMYLIEPDDTLHRKVGVCGLTSIDHLNRRAEFSCYIAPGQQRQGYAEAALNTLFTFGFKELNLRLIWGETFEGNPARKLFEKIGMICTGFMPKFYYKDGKYLDSHFYSIERAKWPY